MKEKTEKKRKMNDKKVKNIRRKERRDEDKK